jgi:hypothetical protein
VVDIMMAGMAVDIMAVGITAAVGVTDIIAAGVHASMSVAQPTTAAAMPAG